MKLRARQRIGHRYADVVRRGLAHQRDGLLDFLPRLRPDSRTAGSSRRGCRGAAGSREPPESATARVPLSIASSTSCEPDSAPIQTSAQPARASASTVSRVIRSQRDCILNGICAPQLAHRGGELARPLRGEREDVVGEPDVVGLEAGLHRPASPPPPAAASAAAIADRSRSASRTSCSGTGSRGSRPCSARNIRARPSRRGGTARRPPGPTRAAAAGPDPRSARAARCTAAGRRHVGDAANACELPGRLRRNSARPRPASLPPRRASRKRSPRPDTPRRDRSRRSR